MKAVFEKIAEELLAIERTNDRLAKFEAQYAARTLGGRFYNAVYARIEPRDTRVNSVSLQCS
jgi:hypothetical protein